MAKNTEELRNVCVSDGTMRTEDLFPKMYWVLKEYAPEKAKEFAEFAEDDSWMGERAEGARVMGELFDALDEIAPEGCYFGSQEGDGACYGFWEMEEESCKRRGRMLKEKSFGKWLVDKVKGEEEDDWGRIGIDPPEVKRRDGKLKKVESLRPRGRMLKEVSEPNRYYGEGKMIRRNSGENVDAWKKYEHAREVLGAEELLTAFATAMNDQNMLEEIIGYIYQDFAEELSESRRPRGRMLREGRSCSRKRMMKEMSARNGFVYGNCYPISQGNKKYNAYLYGTDGRGYKFIVGDNEIEDKPIIVNGKKMKVKSQERLATSKFIKEYQAATGDTTSTLHEIIKVEEV